MAEADGRHLSRSQVLTVLRSLQVRGCDVDPTVQPQFLESEGLMT